MSAASRRTLRETISRSLGSSKTDQALSLHVFISMMESLESEFSAGKIEIHIR